MAVMQTSRQSVEAPKASFLYRPEVRQAIYQIVLVLALFAGFYTIISNTLENMRRQNIASGFGFWNRTAGFDIGQHLVPYSATSSYGDAFWVGMWNTLLIAGIGIILATLIGFVVGIARLSRNWLVARLATVYVETLRNMPLLLQLFFWYFAVLKALPQAREAMQLPGNIDLTGFRFYFIIFVMSVALLALSGIYWVKFRALLARPVMAIGAGLA